MVQANEVCFGVCLFFLCVGHVDLFSYSLLCFARGKEPEDKTRKDIREGKSGEASGPGVYSARTKSQKR